MMMIRNQSKKVQEFEEEKNCRVLETKMRELRNLYVKYRKQYYEELERLLSCAYFQNRQLDKYENTMLEKYYRQYLKCYLEYLSIREKLSVYTKQLAWLRCTA